MIQGQAVVSIENNPEEIQNDAMDNLITACMECNIGKHTTLLQKDQPHESK